MSTPATGQVVYYHDGASFGLLYDAEGCFRLFHIQSFSNRAGYRRAEFGQAVAFQPNTDISTGIFHRADAVADGTLEPGEVMPFTDSVRVIEREAMGREELLEELAAASADGRTQMVLFRNVTFSDLDLGGGAIETHGLSLLFSDCHFTGLCALIGARVDGDLHFLGCSFASQFSLKLAQVTGEVHLEASDFSGSGGASFRGLQAAALYLDFGVVGPADMVWLNEMEIAGKVVIGGSFSCPLQIIGDQDGTQRRASIGELVIGKEYYKSQNINRTVIEGPVEIARIDVAADLSIENAALGQLTIEHSSFAAAALRGSTVDGSVLLRDCRFLGEAECLAVDESIIASRLIIKRCRFEGAVAFDGSTVDKYTYIDQCDFGRHASLSVYDLVCDIFRIEPVATLYHGTRHRFSNQPFHLLGREHRRETSRDWHADPERPRLVQEYTAFRRWLGDQGLLIEEDQAFYNMRRNAQSGVPALLFNYVFGWGVRLWNILLSSLLLVLLYTLLFLGVTGLDLPSALFLSTQSFFNVIFGAWEEYATLSATTLLVVSEGILGVLFITVLVGAYMRKLLR